MGLLAALTLLVLAGQSAFAGPFPTWDKLVSTSSRFKILKKFNGEAVFDKETGLVWERAPAGGSTWNVTVDACYNTTHAGRKGWRLPTIEELTTLVDVTQSNPALPPEHPFNNVQSELYWSATTDVSDVTRAYTVNFATGAADVKPNKTAGGINRWCVRGGHGHDGL